MPKLVGYACVSTSDQDVQLHLNALAAAGCAKSRIFIDKISGVRTERPGLDKCIAELNQVTRYWYGD